MWGILKTLTVLLLLIFTYWFYTFISTGVIEPWNWNEEVRVGFIAIPICISIIYYSVNYNSKIGDGL